MESLFRGVGGQGWEEGDSPQTQPGNKKGIGLARWFGTGFPATVPAIFQVPMAPLQVQSGCVPGEDGLGCLVASCLDKHALQPWWTVSSTGPLRQHTLVHCSSCTGIGTTGALAPHPCPQRPLQSLTWFAHAEVLGLSAATPVGTRVRVLNKSLPYLGDIPSSRDQHSML